MPEPIEEKKILIVMTPDGACKITTQGIPSMPEMIGILETVKAMKVNEMLGIRPMPLPAPSRIIVPKKPGIIS